MEVTMQEDKNGKKNPTESLRLEDVLKRVSDTRKKKNKPNKIRI